MSAREAAAYLDVKPATLYAYVSRGLLHSIPGERGRPRRYALADLQRLRTRRDARRGHKAVAASALRWGDPVLDSAVTEITAEGPAYRGELATELVSQGVSFESVGELLWTGRLGGNPNALHRHQTTAGFGRLSSLLPTGNPPLSTLGAWVPIVGARDPDRFDASPGAEVLRARGLLRSMAAVMGLMSGDRARQARHADRIASIAAGSLQASRGSKGVELLEAALILSADHELNVSTFAVRVVASAGADLYSCVSAGLSAMAGPRHGRMCDRVEALVEECGRPQRARTVIRDRARRGEHIPGFGHVLYPAGDPRPGPLLQSALRLSPRNAKLSTLRAIADVMQERGHPGPTLDIGLTAVSFALGLGPGAAAGLFALGRTAGWVAHALEQRQRPELLRPRARFIGAPTPADPDALPE